ncbi:MAG: hypothetical protein ACREBU_03435 [Nitrososphaera sp.]
MLGNVVCLKPPSLNIENAIIDIDKMVKTGEYVVRNRLGPRGSRRPMKEKQAGHTPKLNPSIEPKKPERTFSVLQSKHFFREYR